MASKTKYWLSISIGIVLTAITVLVLASGPSFSGGTGEPNDPYRITTVQEFLSIGLEPNLLYKHYMLMNDLDFSSEVFTAPVVAGIFEGTFSGNDCALRHLTIDANTSDCVGLFSILGFAGVVSDLTLEDCNVTGRTCVGVLAGSNLGRLSRCVVQATVNGEKDIGSVCGVNAGTVQDCHGRGLVQGDYAIGGLVGSQLLTLLDSHFDGQVQAREQAGALAGQNFGQIEACFSLGSVDGTDQCGGLVGYQEGTISHCYSRATVSGQSRCGGLVGKAFSGLVAYSYAVGPVTGLEGPGGLVGSNYEGTVYLSYWDTTTSGLNLSAGGRGLTAEEFTRKETFTGWGRKGLWTLDTGKEPPRLTWEQSSGMALFDEVPKYGGGSGEPNNPYQIDKIEHLTALGYCPSHWDRHFILIADLDSNNPALDEWIPIGRQDLSFTGILDGQGHTIRNLTFEASTQSWVGLFGVIGHLKSANGVVRDLHLQDVNIMARNVVGALAGQNSGLIEGCEVTSTWITGQDEIGGLVGRNQGTITQSSAQVQVQGTGICIGTLAGSNLGLIQTEQDDSSDLVGCDWSNPD